MIAHRLSTLKNCDYVYKSIKTGSVRRSQKMSQNILVVGGAGYIGTVVSDHFLKKGFNVICVDNFLYENSFSIYKKKIKI